MALLLDEHGHLTETAAANVLLVRGGTILSPPPATILEGVSLAVVRELCGDLHIPFEERPWTVADAQAADEILLTSTPYFLAGVSRFDGQPVPWPGPVYERLRTAWEERLGLDFREQFLGQD
jgi:branched-subunit amino acid aminotransferase/4-amino-4-deoxychorismate lyase